MASKKKTLATEDSVLDMLLSPHPREAVPAAPAKPTQEQKETAAPKPKARPRKAAETTPPPSLEAFRVYSLKEVSTVVGVSTRTLLEYIKEGRLKATKIGVRWRVSPDNLRAFINGEGETPEEGEVSEKNY